MKATRGVGIGGWILLVLIGLVFAEGLPDWLPRGGDLLLVEVLAGCSGCDDLAALAAADRSREEWRDYFDERGALGALTEKEVAALMSYLEINLPRPGLSLAALPEGGAITTLNVCSGCHSPAPVLTGQMVETEWYDFFHVGHGEFVGMFGMDDATLRTMAAYVGSFMPLDLDTIPEPLLRGFEGY
jgi:hypothetical protein